MYRRSLSLLLLTGLTFSTFAQAPYIPPDHKGEAPAPHIAFFPQQGQFADTDGNLLNALRYASYGNPLRIYAFDGGLFSFVLLSPGPDSNRVDTLRRVDFRLIGELVNTEIEPEHSGQVSWTHNYYLQTCPNGITGVKGYERLIYPEVYPGIDMHIYSNKWGYKFYFVVHPGADPNMIQMEFIGQDQLEIDYMGALEIHLNNKEIKLPNAIAYQEISGSTQQVPWMVEYNEEVNDQVVNFVTWGYDPNYPLIIDISQSLPSAPAPASTFPEWATFYGGGSGETMKDMVSLNDGGVAGCGSTGSMDYPVTTGPTQLNGSQDGYLTTFDDQYGREFSTFWGGSDHEEFTALTQRNDGVFVVGGRIDELSIPNVQWQNPGGAYVHSTNVLQSAEMGCFVAFDPQGAEVWSTLFGVGDVHIVGIDADNAGNVIALAEQEWTHPWTFPFPTTTTCTPVPDMHPICGTGFIQDQFAYRQSSNPISSLRYSGLLAKFNSDFQLTWSTLFGGSSWYNRMADLAVDRSLGLTYITGTTLSPQGHNNPCTAPPPNTVGFPWCSFTGGYDQQPAQPHPTTEDGEEIAFVACFDSDNVLVWCTPFGDPAQAQITRGHAIDVSENQVYIVGQTYSDDYNSVACTEPTDGFPICNTANPYNFPLTNGGSYITRFHGVTKVLEWSTIIPGIFPRDVQMDGTANVVYVAGSKIGNLPLVAHPDHYSQPDPAHPGGGAIQGYDANGMFYSTSWGGNDVDELTRVATVGDQRVYLAGRSRSSALFPWHCPPTVNPWCVSTLSGIDDPFYGQVKLDVLVGVEEVENDNSSFTLYPNPNQGQFTVLCNGKDCDQALQLLVYDPLGQLVGTHPFNAQNGNVQVEGLSAGSYSYLVRNKDGELLDRSQFILIK